MTTFYLACAALVLLSALFLFLPLRRAQDDIDPAQTNLQWFRTRSREMSAEEQAELLSDAKLRLLEDDDQPHLPAATAGAGFSRWLLIPVVAALAIGFYYRLGGVTDVTIAQRLQTIEVDAERADVVALMADIERRAEQRPDNLHYLALMARYYMGQSDYDNAAATYEQLLQSVPEDPQILAFAAQARYLSAGRVLDDRARLYAEQALAANPHERTALGLLGMALYEQQQYRDAIRYWERLLVTEAPGSNSRAMIEDVVARAREALGEAPRAEEPAAVQGKGVTISVRLPEGASIDPADTVFVLARNAQSSSRMPIAVQRRSGAELPLTLRLDDSNSMAGQRLSQTPSVLVAVQVSPSGQPGEAAASWLGQAGPLAPDATGDIVPVVLAPK